MEALLGNGPTTLQHNLEDWKLETIDSKKILFYKEKNYIPKDSSLQQDLVRSYHDLETAGHPGELETYNLVKEHYWWPGLRSFVKGYVQGCNQCQQFKINRNPSHPASLPTGRVVSTRPFAHCLMDLITDLPPADGFDLILVVVDQGLSKGIILILCNKTLTAEDTGQLLQDNLYKRFGLPDKIISDRGPQFASQGFKELLWLSGVKSALSTAYHPQTNGTTEWINQEIKTYLAIYCSSHSKTWTKSLTTLEFTHNNWQHADQTKTPFELMFGDMCISTCEVQCTKGHY